MRVAVALLVALLAAASATAGAGKGSAVESTELDGQTWVVKVVPSEAAQAKGEKGFEETLTFAAGRVTMSAGLKRGFEASPYKYLDVGPKQVFRTSQKSESEGSTSWKAVIEGNKMAGTMNWIRNDGTAAEFRFTGERP